MDIEQRFAHLERSNRRLRTGLLSLTIAITTVLIVGQAKPEMVPDVIQAKEFQVVGDNGLPLVRMRARLTGDGVIATFNGKGQKLVNLGEGGVTTYNGKGQRLVSLTASVFGNGIVTTYNDKGQKLVGLSSSGDKGALYTYNGKGQELVGLSTTKHGGAVVTYNDKGQQLVELRTKGDGGGSVVTFGDGRITGSIGDK
jgi:hypothetical protein